MALTKVSYSMIDGAPISVLDFGAVGNGAADDTLALTAAINYWKSKGGALYIPAGRYRYTSLPKMLVNGGVVYGDGAQTQLMHIGAGVAIDLQAASNTWNMEFRDFMVVGNPNGATTYGVNQDKLNHSLFQNIEIRDVSTVGWGISFAVMCRYETICPHSSNRYTPIVTPTHGFGVGVGTASSTAATDCTFVNCIVEGTTGNGVEATNMQACTWIGGTSEGNTGGGFSLPAVSGRNTFINVFCEYNGGLDWDLNGCADTTFINVTGSSPAQGLRVRSGTDGTRLIGGAWRKVQIDSGATNTSGETWALDTYTNSGTNTVLRVRRGNSAPYTYVGQGQEESFSPTFSGTTTAGSITLDVQNARYLVNENICYFQIDIRVSSISSAPTGDLVVGPLPFVSSASWPVVSVAIGNASNLDVDAAAVQLMANISAGSNVINLFQMRDAASVIALPASALAASRITLSGSYKI